MEVILTSDQQNGIISSTITKQNIVDEGTMQAHVIYTISTQVSHKNPSDLLNSQYANEQTSVVARRFNDFVWLQNILEEEHLDILVPPIPEKDALCMHYELTRV